ncbi:MAG: hypothetical protein L0241_06635 [Planctomycetia bacterium]|nr:hypothetical protein [Planctomycetia bacterium]
MSAPEPEKLGCLVCRAVPASRSEFQLKHVRSLYEAPHEGYCLYACRECHQPFLEQFQEITWLPDGEDHIWLRWMPINAEELAEVERLFPTETEDDEHAHLLAKLMHRRGRLVRDPDNRFEWFDHPWDAGNLYPPG